MPTGKTNTPRSRGLNPNRAKDLSFGPARIIVRLVDGRELSVPLVHYPTLRKAGADQRADWELLGESCAIRWESLDLDLSIEGMLQGFRERIPRRPSRAAVRRLESAGKRRGR